MLNKVMLLGKIAKIGGNESSAQVVINIVEKSKDYQGNKQEKTTAVPVYFPGKLAEIAMKYLKPEGLIYLECKIQNSNNLLEIMATDLKFLPNQVARPTQYGKTTVAYRSSPDTPIPF